jgi:Sulfotransferase family
VNRRDIKRSLRTDFSPGAKTRAKRAWFRVRQGAHLPALAMGGELHRPVFIIGAPRSGTSLLYAILRDAGEFAHWPGEAHEVWEADYHPALRGWDSNVLTADDARGQAASRIRRSFFLVAGPRRRLIDKTPRNSLRVSFIDALFGDARFVFLKRDGRENVNSLINAWRTPRYRTYRLPEPHAIPGVDPVWWKFVLYPGWRGDREGPLEVVCARQWMEANRLALDSLARIESSRWTQVAYEDLVDDPVGEVGRIMAWLELPYEPKVRAKAASSPPINTVTPPERGKWKRENPSEVEAIEPLIGPMMERLGYPSA